MSLIGFLATSVHPSVAHMWRPDRYAADPNVHPQIQEKGRETFDGYLKQIDSKLARRDWFWTNIRWPIPTYSFSILGDCAEAIQCKSLRTSQPSRIECWSDLPYNTSWRKRKSIFKATALNFRSWHEADMAARSSDVRYSGYTGSVWRKVKPTRLTRADII